MTSHHQSRQHSLSFVDREGSRSGSRSRHGRERQVHLTKTEIVTLPASRQLAPLARINLEKALLPLLLSVMKAIVVALPNANTLAEVQALLAVEHLRVRTLSGPSDANYGCHFYDTVSLEL